MKRINQLLLQALSLGLATPGKINELIGAEKLSSALTKSRGQCDGLAWCENQVAKKFIARRRL